MRRAHRFLSVAVALSLCTSASSAQGPCSWAPLSGGATPAPRLVKVLTAFDDGSGPALYLAGRFINPTTDRVARWSGSSWVPIGSFTQSNGAFGAVDALAVYDDGSGPSLYATGFFVLVDGVPISGIARWDGQTWSPLGSGLATSTSSIPNGHAMAVVDDGSGPALYVAGWFTSAGGVPVNNIARWDGSSWSAVGAGFTAFVKMLTVFDDGTGPALYAGGDQLIAQPPQYLSGVVKWDGASWSPLPLGPVFNSFESSMAVYDDGTGPKLYAGGVDTPVYGSALKAWDGSSWSSLPDPQGPMSRVPAMAVFDSGPGPRLVISGVNSQIMGSSNVTDLYAWDGLTWSPLGAALSTGWSPTCAQQYFPCPAPDCTTLAVMDVGGGPALYAGGSFTGSAGMAADNIAYWPCGSSIGISTSQVGIGAPFSLANTNLTPGNEYYNILSLDLCPGGAGTGLGAHYGLCLTSAPNLTFIMDQLLAPLETPPYHFIARGSYTVWGPYALPPMTLDALCFDFSNGMIGSVSPVTRIVIQ